MQPQIMGDRGLPSLASENRTNLDFEDPSSQRSDSSGSLYYSVTIRKNLSRNQAIRNPVE